MVGLAATAYGLAVLFGWIGPSHLVAYSATLALLIDHRPNHAAHPNTHLSVRTSLTGTNYVTGDSGRCARSGDRTRT